MEFSLHGVESETHAQVDNIIFKKRKKTDKNYPPKTQLPRQTASFGSAN